MKHVTVRVPLRVDLAGGTLDLWPLYLFHPGARTVNLAVSMYAEVAASNRNDAAIGVDLTDIGHRRDYDSIVEMQQDPQVALIAKAVEHFRLTGVTIVTRTDAPRGSGLGGSSALAVATVKALAELSGNSLEPEGLITLVRDLETRLLGIPAGIQDYYPPVYGGLSTIHLNPGQVVRHAMPLPLAEFAEHLVVYYSGIAHFSGTNNWEIYKRHIDGDEKVVEGLAAVAEAATHMERALGAADFEEAGKTLAAEWQHRRDLFDGIATPEIDDAIVRGVDAGAWAGKVCGAGGGGSIVFLCPSDSKSKVRGALARLPGRVLDISPVGGGITMNSDDTAQKSFSFGGRRRSGREVIEHLYLSNDAGEALRPFVLIEGVITFDEPRRNVNQRVERATLAPLDLAKERIDWSSGRGVNVDDMDLTADPPTGCELSVPLEDNVLVATLGDTEDQAREYLGSTEHLTIYENSAFEIYSEPHETPAEFMVRCADKAKEMIDERADDLESTFRRRIDQIRERSEKNQRENEERDAEDGLKSDTTDPTRGSGQDLYNITTGKGATARSAESPEQADYLEKIALVQKAWEKELEEVRIEMSAKAEAIEEVSLVPTLRNIEIARIVVVWQ